MIGLAIQAALAFLLWLPGPVHASEPPAPCDEGARRIRWGVYRILWSQARYPAQLDASIAELGRPDYVTFFRDIGRPFPLSVCRAVADRGAVPVVSLEIQRWGRPSEGMLEDVARGVHDAFFTRWARDARAYGGEVMLRFGFEMNGNWFHWGCQPEAFRAAWCRAREIFRREGARNVRWVWAPNAISGPDTPENAMDVYWPGDDEVDVIGLDGYNFGDHHSQWHTWTSFAEIFEPALERIRAAGVPHPVLVTEFSCTSDRTPDARAAWIREAFAFLGTRPEVIGAIWFDYDKRREGEKDWRVAADPLSLRAWLETFGCKSFTEKLPPLPNGRTPPAAP